MIGDTITKETKKPKEWTADEWNKKCELLQTWIDEHQQKKYEDTVMTLKVNMNRGKNDKSLRVKSWNAILLEMRDIPDSPVGGRGVASNLPEEVQEALKEIEAGWIAENAHEGRFTRLLTFTRKTDGEGDDKKTIRTFHRSDEVRATHQGKGKIQMLKKMFHADEWDGTIAGLEKIANVFEDDSDD